jgi:glutamate/tyrosine decarboxylase-like PLP-dependent enzyme
VLFRSALRAAINGNIAVAKRLASLIDASDDFERLAPAPLSIVCFRYVPAALQGAGDEAINAFNRTLMVEIQRDGDSYLSNALLGDRFALRACIVNFRTRLEDADHLLATIRRVGGRMSTSV